MTAMSGNLACFVTSCQTDEDFFNISMHSSRMRTAGLLTYLPACTVQGGVSAPWGGCLLPGGGLLCNLRGEGGGLLVPACTDRFRCKNITFANFVCGRYIRKKNIHSLSICCCCFCEMFYSSTVIFLSRFVTCKAK